MGMYGSRAVTLLVLISDDVINRFLKLDIQTNILVYVTRCCTDLTSRLLYYLYNKYGKGAINSLESGFNDVKGAFNQLGDWISSGLQVYLMAQIVS